MPKRKSKPAPKIRIAHWEEIDPFAVKSGVSEFVPEHRFQMVALLENTVVGYWMFDKPRSAGAFIDSLRTQVRETYRRSGIGQRLWLEGIAHYNARWVMAQSATPSGTRFIAKMVIEAWIFSRTTVEITNSTDDYSVYDYQQAILRASKDAFDRHRETIARSKDRKLPTIEAN